MRRRNFLIGVGSLTAAGAFSNRAVMRRTRQEDERKPLDAKLVSEFVGKSHGNFDGVRELIKQEPRLVNAAWDWGEGDWETGLGAASHVGSRPVAELLLESNARMDAFAITMLGLTDVLRPMLVDFPKLHAVPGPHGIAMLSHAIYGGEPANGNFDLLLESGADVNQAANAGMTPLMAAAGMGRADLVEVLLEKGADPSRKNSRGQDALEWARQREHKNVIAILERHLGKE